MIQELFKIRNELYDAIPVKNVETWELLKVIKNHLAKLDALMEANKISSNLPVISSVCFHQDEWTNLNGGDYWCKKCETYRKNRKQTDL